MRLRTGFELEGHKCAAACSKKSVEDITTTITGRPDVVKNLQKIHYNRTSGCSEETYKNFTIIGRPDVVKKSTKKFTITGRPGVVKVRM